MQFWTFDFAKKFPAIFQSCRKPIENIPVVHDGNHLCCTTLTHHGFPLVLPLNLALMLTREEAYISLITRRVDGRLEVTGLEVRIVADEAMPD